jgi:hypothetical protein
MFSNISSLYKELHINPQFVLKTISCYVFIFKTNLVLKAIFREAHYHGTKLLKVVPLTVILCLPGNDLLILQHAGNGHVNK